MRVLGWALLLMAAALVVAAPAGAQDAVYRIAPGDELKVNVFDHPEISGDYQVDAVGNISFPLLGAVRAAGLTVDELKGDLTYRLNADYLVDPKLSVEVLNFRPIFVIGQVNAPGSYSYASGMTVRQAVALAGGYTRRASTSSMTIIRQNAGGGVVEVEAYEDTVVLPGDTIEIDRRFL